MTFLDIVYLYDKKNIYNIKIKSNITFRDISIVIVDELFLEKKGMKNIILFVVYDYNDILLFLQLKNKFPNLLLLTSEDIILEKLADSFNYEYINLKKHSFLKIKNILKSTIKNLK